MQFSKVLKHTAVAAAALFLVTQWMLSGNLSLLLTAPQTVKNESKAFDAEDFEQLVWPRLQTRLCPAGVPTIALGKTLFQLARYEISDTPAPKKLNPKLIHTFYDDTHGAALVVDGTDPSASLLYVRIWKCANSQIRKYLQSNSNQRPLKNGKLEAARQKLKDKKNRESLKYGIPVASQGSGQNRRLVGSKSNNTTETSGNYSYIELEGDVFRGFFRKHAMKDRFGEDKGLFRYRNATRNKPCVFTVIRDPISHFLSGYNEIEYRILTGRVKLKTKNPPAYTKIPYNGTTSLFDRRDPNTLRELRFEQFVRDLAEEDISFYSQWVYQHIYPMARMLHTLKRLKLLPTLYDTPQDWILPSVANLTHTLPIFLRQRCPQFSALPPLEIKGQHKSTQDPLGTYHASKTVWNQGGAVARSLCHLHAFDYACFYGTNGGSSLQARDIPSTCQKVYASEWFQQSILGS